MNDASTHEALWEDLIDIVLPLLPPYEFTLYVLLLRKTNFAGGDVQLGKRTISALLGNGVRASSANYQQITKKLEALDRLGFIVLRGADRNGTALSISLPEHVPSVLEAKAGGVESGERMVDYFTDPELRHELMQRDKFKCQYCWTDITPENATLDHKTPQHAGGPSTPENLVTACLLCNSIKSGRSLEDAAPDILASLKRR